MNLLKQKWITIFAWVLFASLPTFVLALPANEVETFYYSDASKTRPVGTTLLLCNGRLYSRGQKTRYHISDIYPCGGYNLNPLSPPCEFTTDPNCQNLPTPRGRGD